MEEGMWTADLTPAGFTLMGEGAKRINLLTEKCVVMDYYNLLCGESKKPIIIVDSQNIDITLDKSVESPLKVFYSLHAH